MKGNLLSASVGWIVYIVFHYILVSLTSTVISLHYVFEELVFRYNYEFTVGLVY